MAESDNGSVNYAPVGTVPPLPPLTLTLSQVAEKIQELRLLLSARNAEVVGLQVKYDRAVVEVAHAAREIAQLQ